MKLQEAIADGVRRVARAIVGEEIRALALRLARAELRLAESEKARAKGLRDSVCASQIIANVRAELSAAEKGKNDPNLPGLRLLKRLIEAHGG